MRHTNTPRLGSGSCWVSPRLLVLRCSRSPRKAAAPGITRGFPAARALQPQRPKAAYISQPDGTSIYSWGYGFA